MDNPKKFAYEFFRRVPCAEEDRLIGVLPERRKDPERITHSSIMNWAKLLAPEDFFEERIYFVRVEGKCNYCNDPTYEMRRQSQK